MAKTASSMLTIGTKANDFSLLDTASGDLLTLETLKSEAATLVMFLCNHCPYVIHVNKALVELANDYMPKGISIIAISSNDASQYPQDGPEKMTEHAKANHYPFPYLYDKDQSVAKAFRAACTPDFYLLDKDLRLIYRGQMDSSRPSNDLPVNAQDLRHALDNVLDGQPVNPTQKPSLGCNIKWKEALHS